MIFIRKKRQFSALSDIICVFLFLLVFFLSVWSVRTITDVNNREEMAVTEQAIRHAAVTCYALEGRYPEDLGYLLKNYHITINTDRYTVHYSATGPNLMPDIAVLPKNTD